MKLAKFLLTVTLASIFAILYVYQQSEIFRLAYAVQKSQAAFVDLLDKNTALRYNIESSASLIRLGSKISLSPDYEMPQTYQLVKLNIPLEKLKTNLKSAKKKNIIAQFFSVKREAQARTINP